MEKETSKAFDFLTAWHKERRGILDYLGDDANRSKPDYMLLRAINCLIR